MCEECEMLLPRPDLSLSFRNAQEAMQNEVVCPADAQARSNSIKLGDT